MIPAVLRDAVNREARALRLVDPNLFTWVYAQGDRLIVRRWMMFRVMRNGHGTRKSVREAAIQIDRARGRVRNSQPKEALELWKDLVEGRCSMVDWFDHHGRRYVLAHPNPAHLKDPRGLTECEARICAYVALGQSNKLISARLGTSTSRVSAILRSAMRKIGVQTRAQLVERLRGFQSVA